MHAAEDVLSMVRRGDRPITARVYRRLPDLPRSSCSMAAMRSRRAANFPMKPTLRPSASLPALRPAKWRSMGRRPARLSSGVRRPRPRRSPFCEEQIFLLAVCGEGFEGRIASAGRLAANVFRHLGRFDEAERIAGSLTESLAGLDSASIARAIELAMVRSEPPSPHLARSSRSPSGPIPYLARCASTPNGWTRSWGSPEN